MHSRSLCVFDEKLSDNDVLIVSTFGNLPKGTQQKGWTNLQ